MIIFTFSPLQKPIPSYNDTDTIQSKEAFFDASQQIPWAKHFSVVENPSLDVINGTSYSSAAGIVEIENDDLLLSTYVSISQLQKIDDKWQISTILPPQNISIWNPAGMFYDKANRTLYVANYKGRDVLICSIDADRKGLTLQKRITDESMMGPENVWVDSPYIWVADYDGNAVFKFDDNGNRLLKIDILQAHGILVTQHFVYCTSLASRSIIQLDKNGSIIRKQGELGITPGDYLWPVSLIEADNGEIVVLDAQMGRLTFLDANLKPRAVLGSNGPGLDLLNYPYGLIRTEKGYILADTKKSRLIIFTKTWEINQTIGCNQDDATKTDLPDFYGMTGAPYTFPNLSGLNIFPLVTGVKTENAGEFFYGGFNSIDSIRQENSTVTVTKEFEIDDPSFPYFIDKTYWYMTWVQLIEDNSSQKYLLFGSPQKQSLLFVDLDTGAFFNYPIQTPAWTVNGRFVSNTGSDVNYDEAISHATYDFSKLKHLIDSGISRSEAYRQVFYPTLPKEDFPTTYWKQLLSHSQTQREFWIAYNKNSDFTRLIDEYYLESLSDYYVYIRSLLAMRYLSGMQFDVAEIPKTNILFESDARFYPGYDLESSINNDNPYKYASSLENEQSYNFSLVLKSPRMLNSVLLRWHEASVPQTFEVTFFDNTHKIIDKKKLKEI